MSDKRNRYSEHLTACYAARIRKNQTTRYTLWAIITDAQANVNYRIAALQAWAEEIPAFADDYEAAAYDLYALSREADGQGAHALADVAWDLADTMHDDADNAREWARCGNNPNLVYGTPRGFWGA
jgi:hypothetical protein